jgi:hypothetical protein
MNDFVGPHAIESQGPGVAAPAGPQDDVSPPGHSPGSEQPGNGNVPGGPLLGGPAGNPPNDHGPGKGNHGAGKSDANRPGGNDNNGAKSAVDAAVTAINNLLTGLLGNAGNSQSEGGDSAQTKATGATTGSASHTPAEHEAQTTLNDSDADDGDDGGNPGPNLEAGASSNVAGRAQSIQVAGEGDKSSDPGSAIAATRDKISAIGATTLASPTEYNREFKNAVAADVAAVKIAALSARFGAAGFLDEQAAGETPTVVDNLIASVDASHEGSRAAALEQAPLTPDGSIRLLDSLAADLPLLEQAMQRFFSQLEGLQQVLTARNSATALAGPWLVTGAILTVAGDAARRKARKTSRGWVTAARANADDEYGPLVGLSF